MKVQQNNLLKLLLFRRGEILPYRHKILLLNEVNGCGNRTKPVRDSASTYKDDKSATAPNKER